MILIDEFDLYKTQLTAYGDRKRDRIVNKIQRGFNKLFDHPSCKEVLINDSEISVNLIVIDGELKDRKEIRSFPGETFNLADRIFFKNKHWLVTEIDSDDEIYTKGLMKRCSFLLRWQNKYTLEIVERWGFSSNPYSADITESKQLDYVANKINIVIPLDEETELLDMDKRFLTTKRDGKPVSYKLVGHDAATQPELLSIKIQEDSGTKDKDSHIDNWDLMIADYIDPTIKIDIINIKEVLVGSTTQLIYIIKNANGIIKETPIFQSSNENIAIIDENGFITAINEGLVNISVIYQNAIKSVDIEIRPDVLDNFELRLIGDTTLQIGRSSEYKGFIYNNGVITDESIIWSLDDLGVDKIAILSVVDDNVCKIIVNSDSKMVGKNFRVVGTNINNGVSEYIEVTVKSLI